MGRPKKIEDESEKGDKGAEDTGDSATVSWRGNTRVYSKEIHGDDFADLAKEFATKVGGEVA